MQDGSRICAVPFQDARFSGCAKDLEKKIDILICHGTLYDPSFIFSSLEEEAHYMPIYPANLEGLARYVALGHLHSRYISRSYKNATAVYPGSPIALDTKCTSKRVICHVKITHDAVRVEPVSVDIAPHWAEIGYFVYPGIEEQLFEKMSRELRLMKKDVMPAITVQGFINIPESEFANRIERLKTDFSPQFPGFKVTPERVVSWDRVMQNRTVQRFVEKTAGLDDELRMKVFEISFPIFSDIAT
jgi:DNA repair exonuclease SbcCD nuclease subunit